MRILCLIMVGAFLLTIAIAENGDSQRVKNRPQASMVVSRRLPQSRNVPWSMRRTAESSQTFTPSNGMVMLDNIASPAISVPQYVHREHKAEPAEGSMILEPMHQRPSRPGWMDWIPDFFDDDPPPRRGPLIGPIDFPGLSRNLYIRQNEPLDDDTNHVVIHVINRQAPSYSTAPPALAKRPIGNNQISYYNKNPIQHAGSFHSNTVKSSKIEVDTAQYPYKLIEGNDLKLQTYATADNEIKDKKSQYPFFDAPRAISSEKFHFEPFSTTAKPAGNPRPSIAWSQRFDGQPIIMGDRRGQHYGRSIESKGPVVFPAVNTTATPIKQEQTYAWHRKYGYQNNTKATSENVRAAAANLRAKLAEITATNHRQVNRINNASSRVSRTSDTSSRLPRNRFSHFNTANDTQRSPVYQPEPSVPEIQNIGLDFVTREVSSRHAREYSPHLAGDNETQKSPVYIHKSSTPEDKGALEVVNAPMLNNTTDGTTGKNSNDVIQNIMTMTASQQWYNISSNVIETEKILTRPMEAQRRVDIVTDDEEETKESTTTTTMTTTPSTTTTITTTTTVALPVSTANKTDKSKPNVQEAVERMMSSFTQWRYKVVSTNFLKGLDSKEENESKQDR